MYYPWWQHHEAAVIKMSYSVEQHMFLVKHDGDMLHPEKCMVCCAPLQRWANFFNSTVTADLYLHVLQEEFRLFLQGMGFSFGGTFSTG
jgi:hypothetical protein